MRRSLSLALLCTLLCTPGAWASPITKAEGLIGQGETWADNRGAFVAKIGKEGQPWCAYFVSYCLKLRKPIPNARGFLKAYPRVHKPLPGDLAIWSRGKDGRSGHIGIVQRVEKGAIYTIEGNTGSYPSKVKVIKHSLKAMPTLLGYVRPYKKGA